MPAVTTIAQYRSRRRKQERRSPLGRLGLGCSGLLALLLAVLGIYTAFTYSRATRNLPSIETLPGLLEPPDGLLLQPTRFYDRSGQHVLLELQNPAAAGREYLRLPGPDAGKEPVFSDALIQATLAAADPDFYRHSGYSLAGLFTNRPSTLAQRLVSDLLLADEPPSLRGAFRERILAAQITHRFGRDKVLEWYLNSAAYGRLAYGADAAARLYLGKSAADLDLAEAAVIAGVALDPLANPIDNPQAALQRQKSIVLALLNKRLVTPDAASRATQQTLAFIPGGRPGQSVQISDLAPSVDPAFLQLALEAVESQIPRRRLERGGLNILTTLDYELQAGVACAVNAQVVRSGGRPLPGQARTAEATDCPAARLLPGLDTAFAAPDLSAAALVLAPQSGQVLALVSTAAANPAGGPLPAHPPGALGTPFIYLTAFTRGLGPASLVWDIPPVKNTGPVKDTGPVQNTGQGNSPEPSAQATSPAAPANEPVPEQLPADGEYHGPVRLRTALVNDYLRPAEQVLDLVGVDNVWRTAQQFGLTAPRNLDAGPPTAWMFLRPLDLLEVGQAYGVLANNGLLAGRAQETAEDAPLPAGPPPIRPTTVLRVETAQPSAGSTRLDWSAWQTRPIISAQLAYLINHVLSDETARWAGLGHPNPLEIGQPAAAKIGGGPDLPGAWTAGYTPQRVAVIWLGLPDGTRPHPEDAKVLVDASAGLYHAIIKTAHADLPVENWQAPEGVTTVRVCDPSGMLPTVYCPNVVDEIFLAGNEPLQNDRLFRSVPVNRETGRLATIFTPPDLVEDHPYLLAPPEAAAWAQQTGLETPPDLYDTLTGELPTLPGVQIDAPQLFATVSRQVELHGSAAGSDFSSYRVQVGKGLNPQEWTQIGEDVSSPVRDGVLAAWDTTGLSGLYAIELLVVRTDDSVQRAVTLVTVDNQPPEVEIVSPVQQEEISQATRPEMVLLADVEDDLETASVEIYLDGRSLASFRQPPYAILWTCLPGEHTLRVVAVDQAGNTSEESITFTVID